MSRTTRGGVTSAYEFMRIWQAADGSLSFTAQPSGQPEATFKLKSHTAVEVVFENPGHDFPQRVIYRRPGRGLLFARVEGESGGKARGFDYRMKKVRCRG
jgi:hypothetical protein